MRDTPKIPIIGEIQRYFRDVLDVGVAIAPWDAANLPEFLRHGYRYFHMELLGSRLLLMWDRRSTEQSPAVIRKHIAQLRVRVDEEIVYVRAQIMKHNRKRLIEHRVPFIIPGNQTYLPMLGVDLREHFRRQRIAPTVLSPSTHVMLIDALLSPTDGIGTATQMSRRLGYSVMTMTRAFNELEAAELAEVWTQGRERWVQFTANKRALWERALPMLRTPVIASSQIVGAPAQWPAPLAGLSALAEYSMLAAPARPVYALGRKQWLSMRASREVEVTAGAEHDGVHVEVWAYSPNLFSKRGVVDPLSLYLSLRNEDDERVQQAVGQMMETVKW